MLKPFASIPKGLGFSVRPEDLFSLKERKVHVKWIANKFWEKALSCLRIGWVGVILASIVPLGNK